MAKEEKEKEREEFRTLDDKIDNVILESRRIFFFDQVDNGSARVAIRKIWYLELTNPGKPITFFINSPGGSIDAGFSIWDQVKMISSPVITCKPRQALRHALCPLYDPPTLDFWARNRTGDRPRHSGQRDSQNERSFGEPLCGTNRKIQT